MKLGLLVADESGDKKSNKIKGMYIDRCRQTYQIYSSISKGITAKIYQRLQHDYKYQNDFDYVHKRVFKVGESSAHFRNPHK